MKKVSIRNGIFILILFEAAAISLVMIVSMAILYKTYTGLVFNETAEVLNLHAMIINSRISEFEKLSFEILADHDIQRNLTTYKNAASEYESYTASNDLYTQLFTRCAMDRRLLSIGFVFLDGERVVTDGRRAIDIPREIDDAMLKSAYEKEGACGWSIDAGKEKTAILYRLIRDISGNGFKPLGVLFIYVDAGQLLAYPSVVPQNRKPEMFCVAGDHILSESAVSISREEAETFLHGSALYDIVNIAGRSYFVAVKQSASTAGWHFVYLLSSGILLGAITNVYVIHILAMLAVLALVIAIGFALANAISSPIVRLADTMKTVESGDYKIDPEPRKGRIAIDEVALLSSDFSRMIKKIDHLVNEVYAEKLLSMEMKYKILQQQINPHFLYNTLDTINWKANENGKGDISLMVRSLSHMLRGSIKGSDEVTVGEDVLFVESYVSIQRIRFEGRIDFAASIQPEVLKCMIPRMTLQPIVENCVVHNIEKYSGTYEIRLYSSVGDGTASIVIDDNGQGIDPTRLKQVLEGHAEAADGSIGLYNINERIKIRFGEGFGLRIENREPVGTRVTVRLPLKELTREHPADR